MPRKKPDTDDQPKEAMTQTSIRVPERVWLKVRGMAGGQGKSANEWVVELLERVTTDQPDEGRKGGVCLA